MSGAPEMECREFVERVTDYLEGALAPEDRARLEAHLATCPHCRLYLEQMRATLRLTGRLGDTDVPTQGREDLLRAFRRWRDEQS